MKSSEWAFMQFWRKAHLLDTTMLINRTFPFCTQSQRATLSASVAESPHSLGPIHVFPMLQFTHWIRFWPEKKCFSPNYHLARRRGEAVWRGLRCGGEILKPFHQCCLVSPVPPLERVMCFLAQKEDLQRYAKSLESVFAGPVKRPLWEALRTMEHGHRHWFTLSTASISHAPGATAGLSKGTTLVRVIERPFFIFVTQSVQWLLWES